MEKSGAQELISTEPRLVADDSSVLLGEGGRPVSLRDGLSAIGAAFRLPDSLFNVAQSIQGLWKTELFFGSTDLDRWVGASVSIGQLLATNARAPRIVITPQDDRAVRCHQA
jgi:cation transport regulator ChaC